MADDYGHQHRKLRKQIKVAVDLGQAWCWRCEGWIQPGTPWDLGHDDFDRSIYRGPEHRACNRATSGRNGNIPVTRWTLGAARKGRACEVCGAAFDANHKDQRTCGKACGMELQRRSREARPTKLKLPKAPLPARACSECDTEFVPKSSRNLTCSQACSKRRGNRWVIDRYHSDPEFRQQIIDRAKASYQARTQAI